MEKKAKEFMILTQSVSPSNKAEFLGRINSMLAEGWDVLTSQSIGLDTGGGVSGAGNVMMVVSLVRYEYFRLVDNPPASA